MNSLHIDPILKGRLEDFYKSDRKITVLTGAGLSADSGIPTFRDVDGFWTVGSKNYMPEEMGTLCMFRQKPLEVWKWFLYRNTICSKALPNKGHFAITELEKQFGDRFRLITQNVDGLHQKAGTTSPRTFLIHGTLDKVRCGEECSNAFYPFPAFAFEKDQELSPEQTELLKCPQCREYLRPHVLWFDEYYNEKFYKFDSSLRVAKETGLLLTIGTSGATNLPLRVTENVLGRHGMLVDINPNANAFSEIAYQKKNGFVIRAKSSEALPEFVELFRQLGNPNAG